MTETISGDTSKTTDKQTQASWTFMLYLAGDNNLSYDMVWTIKELYGVRLPQNISITVQFDPLVGVGTRFYLRRGEEPPMYIDGGFDHLGTGVPGPVNTGDPNVLAAFIERSMCSAPADHYALVLSGHGGGIEGDFLTDYHAGAPPSHADKGLRQHHNTANDQKLEKGSLTIIELGQTLAKLRNKIDVLGMDSCLMSMAEVASQVRLQAENNSAANKHTSPKVDYLVASEGFVEATGWPYYRLLELLKRHADEERTTPGRGGLSLTPKECAISLVNRCVNYYADYRKADVSFDMAAIEVAAIRNVEVAVGAFVKKVLALDDKKLTKLLKSVVVAHWRAQSYKWELYTDLWDFFNELRTELRSQMATDRGAALKPEGRKDKELRDISELCENILTAVADAVACSRFAGTQFQHSHGLSVYFPWSKIYYAADYEKTKFADTTKWHKFLLKYFEKTRRETRSQEDTSYPKIPDGWQKYPLTRVQQNGNGDVVQPILMNVRTNAPYGRTNAPYGRLFNLINGVDVTKASMKNPAGTDEDYIMLPKQELEALKRAIELEKQKMAEANKKCPPAAEKGAGAAGS